MIVVRNYKGNIARSKCCADCIQIMKSVGIRKVYYSTPDGLMIEKVSEMTNSISGGRQKLKRNI